MSDAVVVLGMHRSGTSAVAGVLTKLGGGAPKNLMPAHPSNSRGFFESLAFMGFHDELLRSAGSSWSDWRRFNPDWRRSPAAADFRRRAKDLFLAEFDGAPMPILKDPRICRFAPFWLDTLREMRVTPHIAMPIRAPLDVARSLESLYGFSAPRGLLLWLRNVLDAEAESREDARSIFSWRDFRADWRGVSEKIASDTHLSWPRLSDRAAHEIERFLAKELIHHESDARGLAAHSDIHEWTLRTYEALLELTRNPHSNSALATLDEVRGLLNQSGELFGRVLVDYEVDLEEARAQLEATAGERDDLRAREAAARSEFAARVEAAERALEAASREKEALAHSLAGATAERDALHGAHAELTARAQDAERALQDASREKEALARALSGAVAERDALAARVQETQLRRDALAREHEALRLSAAADRAKSELEYTELARKHAESLATIESVRIRVSRQTAARAEQAAALDRALQEKRGLAAKLEQKFLKLRLVRDRAAKQEGAHAKSLADAQRSHESAILALRSHLLDAEAGLAYAKVKAARKGVGAWLTPAAARRGVAKRLLRGGLFDVEFYREQYPNADNDMSAAEHYVEEGCCSGFRPNAWFDTRWYLDRYEDVRRSGANPLLHYLLHGAKEGRDPGPNFQTNYYLEANPDVRAQGVNPLAHYIRHGRHEGRLAVRPT